MTTPSDKSRPPRAIATDDPALVLDRDGDFEEDHASTADDENAGTEHTQDTVPLKPGETLRQGIRWGSILVSAMAALAMLAASLSLANFVADVVQRDDWVGWLGFGLATIAGIAFVVLAIRELFGLIRVSRLSRLRHAVEVALRDKDLTEERQAITRLQMLYAPRDDLKWPLARLKDHQSDVRDSGELLRLADREVMTPLDRTARTLILKSAKRVTVATAISPMVWIAMLYVVAENLRLIKALATLYGARPGSVGALRLGRMVFTHILATGGLAMTDDLLGQFLGQDLVRRLSRRLGEGVFNGALTARIGTAAVSVIRPLPFLDAQPLRLRDIMRELVRTTAKTKA